MGGDGVVSVASNQVPGELVALCAAAQAGDWDDGAPDPRALAAALPGQLPRRPEPGAGEGRPRADGPARRRRRPRAAPAARPGRPGRDGRRRSARSGCSRRRAGGWPTPARRPARRSHDRRDRRSRRDRRRLPSIRRRSSTTSRPGASARPSPTTTHPTAGASDPEVKAAILACFADRTTRDLDGRAADVPRPGRRPAPRRPRGRAVADRPGRHGRPPRGATSATASS